MSSRQASRRVCDSGARLDGRSTAPPGRLSVPMASSLSPKRHTSTSTSSSLRTSSAGASGVSLAVRSLATTRSCAATAASTLTAFSSLSQVSKAKILHLTAALEHQVDLLDGATDRCISAPPPAPRPPSRPARASRAASVLPWVPVGGRGFPHLHQVPGRRLRLCGYFWRSGYQRQLASISPHSHAAQVRQPSTHLNHGPAQDRRLSHPLVLALASGSSILRFWGTADDLGAVASVRRPSSSPRRRPPRGSITWDAAAAPYASRPPGTARRSASMPLIHLSLFFSSGLAGPAGPACRNVGRRCR